MFNKKEYWSRRNNVEKIKDPNGKEIEVKKPLRGQGDKVKPTFTPNKTAEIGFNNNGEMVLKNRAYRRKPIRLPKAQKITKRKKK